ncbi:Periphilin-1 [Manis pentadactyla]|nr:Periphilin-1 [Manis pentadactyla]
MVVVMVVMVVLVVVVVRVEYVVVVVVVMSSSTIYSFSGCFLPIVRILGHRGDRDDICAELQIENEDTADGLLRKADYNSWGDLDLI